MLHPGQVPEPHDLGRAWTFAPLVVIALVISSAAYARGAWVRRQHSPRARNSMRMQAACFAGAIAALTLALVSPIDAVGSALFSVHMVQHLLLIGAAAPLLVLGDPLIVMLWAFPISKRRSIGAWWQRAHAVHTAWRVVRFPLVAWTLHVAALWLWHVPSAYDRAMRSEWVHVAEHVSFLATALVFWWVMLKRRHTHGIAGTVLYLFAAGLQSTILGTLLALARRPWYIAHFGTTTAWGLTPLEDQQLAGLIMWIPGGLIYLVPTLYVVLPVLLQRTERYARGFTTLPAAMRVAPEPPFPPEANR